ncbi:MAG: nuclear transport factor 2 family protein, partial [Anaerolineae bacterium]|nr:nuclear transport factor 2 family protein [Anaerolineae bacterium]
MSPTRMARVEAAPRIVLAFNEALNRHDVAGMMQLVSDDCVLESAGPAPDGAVYKGKEAVTRYWEEFFRESPQAHVKLEEVIGLGWRCVARWRYEWVDGAGKSRYVRGVGIFRVQNGVVREQRCYVKGKIRELPRAKAPGLPGPIPQRVSYLPRRKFPQ